MGARDDPKKLKEKLPEEEQEEEQAEQGTQIVEVPINLELINNKLNFIIAKLDSMSKVNTNKAK